MVMLINSDVASLLLSHQKIAFIIIDSAWRIQQIGGKLAPLFAGVEEWLYHERMVEAAPTVTTAQMDQIEANLIGQSIAQLLPELIGLEAELQAVYMGAKPSLQLEFINREDQANALSYLTLTVYPYPADSVIHRGLLCLVEDVTPVGAMNQRLTQQHNQLYLLHQALERSHLDLAAANAELRALDELKSRFVSIAAHELRSPLASVLGYADFILQDDLEPLGTHHRKGVETIQRSARRLLAVANDLLDVTRIEAGKLELTLQSINLVLLTKALIEVLEPELAQKGHRISLAVTDEFPAALCDEKRALQILTNLLSNAIKYTPERGEIQVRFGVDPREQMIVVAVADNGIGIPAQDLPKIGKSFFRASNVHYARASGAGLGLNITISLVELHGGKFWVESEQGRGTTAYVTFALAAGL